MRIQTALGILVVLVHGPLAGADIESRSLLSSKDCRTEETELGDLVSDALRERAKTPVAFIPAGALREIVIPKGKVDAEKLLDCLHYPNDHIAVLELTGEMLVKAVERSVSVYPQKNLGFLQVSGISFTFDPTASRGSRVSEVRIGDAALDPAGKYRVATTEPLAKGGHGYFTVWTKDEIKEKSSATVTEAVKRLLTSRQSLDYGEKNRIKVRKAQANANRDGAPSCFAG